MKTFRWIGAFAFVVSVALFANSSVLAQATFPSRPMEIVNAFAPGGSVDLHARALAEVLQRYLKRPVAVVSRPGAGGVIGYRLVATSKPDGHTLLFAPTSLAIHPEVAHALGRKPPYTLEQFAPIARVAAAAQLLVVASSAPWESVADLVADARRRPNEILYASSGVNGGLHVATEMFSRAAGIKLRHVPYNGLSPVISALLGGHVNVAILQIDTAMPHLQSGTLRSLATMEEKRVSLLPDVPTMKEAGYDVEYSSWFGLFAPRETPPAVIRVLRHATKQAVNDQEFAEAAVVRRGATGGAYLDADEFEKYLREWVRAFRITLRQLK